MKALIIVDIQNDFCPGGALAVQNGLEIVPIINRLQSRFDVVVATQDWHPWNHKSFASQNNKNIGELIELNGFLQVMWPDHCIQETKGAAFVDLLDMSRVDKVFRKGMNIEIDSYSGFFDNDHKNSTGLAEYLKNHYVEDVYVVGLATDYCVKFTALDAKKLGFNTYLIEDACRGVDLRPGDVKKSIQEMIIEDIAIMQSCEV